MGLHQSYLRNLYRDSNTKYDPSSHSINITSMYVIILPKYDNFSTTSTPVDSTSESSSDSVSEKKCVICLENMPDHIITTCWHKCLCYNCGIGITSCPICRAEYDHKTQLKKVFE